MSPTEIVVLIGGLALGYWVVSKLFDDLNRDQKPSAPEQSAPQNATAAGGKPAEPADARNTGEGGSPTKDTKP